MRPYGSIIFGSSRLKCAPQLLDFIFYALMHTLQRFCLLLLEIQGRSEWKIFNMYFTCILHIQHTVLIVAHFIIYCTNNCWHLTTRFESMIIEALEALHLQFNIIFWLFTEEDVEFASSVLKEFKISNTTYTQLHKKFMQLTATNQVLLTETVL